MTSSSRGPRSTAARIAPLLLAIGLGGGGAAVAGEPDPPPPPAPPAPSPLAGALEAAEAAEAESDAEVIVYGDLEVAARRRAVDRDLRVLGYRPGVRKGDTTVYRPESPWKPTVVVHDEGFIHLKRSPVRFAPPGQKQSDNKLRYLWCLPPFTPMCLRIGGVVVSDAKLEPQKARVVMATRDDVHAWSEAIVARAMSTRVGEDVPNQLDALWRSGTPLDGHAGVLADARSRRSAMLSFWADRTCTPEGDAVAEVVALFLEYEVQTSPWPVTRAEESAANAATSCARRLALPPGSEGIPAP